MIFHDKYNAYMNMNLTTTERFENSDKTRTVSPFIKTSRHKSEFLEQKACLFANFSYKFKTFNELKQNDNPNMDGTPK